MRTKLLLLLICFYLISCKKENDVIQPINNDNIGDNIIVGSTSNLIIKTYNKSFCGGYNAPYYFDLELNGDNRPDIRFNSVASGSQGTSPLHSASILCLNSDCQLYGSIKDDTIYFKEVIGSDYINKYFSCRKYDPQYSVYYIYYNNLNLVPINFGNIIIKTDNFKTDTCNFSSGSIYSYSNMTYNNGVYVLLTTYYDYSCFAFPFNDVNYIGFKIKVSGIEKLGWIRMSVNEYQISVFESAVQK